MKIKDIMTRNVATCSLDDNLAVAAGRMWEHDCGVIPVLGDGRLIGILSDRDIAIAAATRLRSVHEIPIREVVQRDLHACHIDDDPKTAVSIMAREKVRRLPVVDDEDRLQGILSLNDLILLAEDGARGRHGVGLTYGEVMRALKEISRHPDVEEELRAPAKARESA